MSLNYSFIDSLSELFGAQGDWFRTKLFPLVEQVMAGYKDPSHDILHVGRVVKVALELAQIVWSNDCLNQVLQSEMKEERFFRLVALSALCHDVGDHKYPDASRLKCLVSQELTSVLGAEVSWTVFEIGGHVSWSREQRTLRSGEPVWRFPNPVHQAVLSCVQDADRLDAIGAVGFARCVAFGAANGRQGFQRVIDHWHEKLKRVPEFMKTEEGRRRAEDKVHLLGVMIAGLERELG